MTEPVILTQQELEAALVYWQRVLRLQDWHITVKLVQRKGLEDDERCAESEWISHMKAGRIRILDAVSYMGDNYVRPYDAEESLVHELVHGHIEPIFKGMDHHPKGGEAIPYEQAVEMLAQALVYLKRAANAPPMTIKQDIVYKIQESSHGDGVSVV